MTRRSRLLLSLFTLPVLLASTLAVHAEEADKPASLGYYRSPAIHGDTVVFTSEGDLWRVPVTGGAARRLTSHPAEETGAVFSPDGKTIAFAASYEGPTETYVMSVEGGTPTRITYFGGGPVAWTPDGKVLVRSSKFSTLPDAQLVAVDPKTRTQEILPLAQASEGCYDATGKTLFFTRLSFQGSNTKRYQGGTAQNLWKFAPGMPEAVPLTADFKGTSKSPMWYKEHVYFLSDRDGVMNLWVMDEDGKNVKQLTNYTDFDIASPDLNDGRIVYQRGADLYEYEIATGKDAKISINLTSDFDQTREKWVTNPQDWVTSTHVSPKGDKIVLTARGQVFVASTAKGGRIVEITRNKGVRYREARFAADGKSIVALSDESGEVELWKLPVSGDQTEKREQLTKDSMMQRWNTLPSPDGKYIAHHDKKHRLFLYEVATKTNKLIATGEVDDINDYNWSPDSRYLAYADTQANTLTVLKVYEPATDKTIAVTTDRYQNHDPAFTPDGKYLYFLSERRFQTSVGSPWGSRQPEPYFDKQTQLFAIALQKGLRSPFDPEDEVAAEKDDSKPDDTKKDDAAKKDDKPAIDPDGIMNRLMQVPIPAGNYFSLTTDGKRLYFVSRDSGSPANLVSVMIRNEDIRVETFVPAVNGYELSQDLKKILVQKGGASYVVDAGGPPDLSRSQVDLGGWSFSFDPREEWRQMFDDAWRLHRDYFYASNMHGVDWPALKKRYRPLVDRVASRDELSDILAQMMGELSVLHTFVYGGDERGGTDNIGVATLGATWKRDEGAGGYRITRIYRTDPDIPGEVGPLLKPGVDAKEGDVITEINGVPTLSVVDAASLLRAQGGKPVRLRLISEGKTRDVIATALGGGRDSDLRYDNWEFSRRKQVEATSQNTIGYVHLRAMGGENMTEWMRDYYPVFTRQGLIIDVRHNQGGNIDSWILSRLLRKAWMFWEPSGGSSKWNMHYAFRGPMVVLCDEWTASDGEAFSEGFKRLGIGKVIGTRTWGGEVWLSSDNGLVDNGIATAAEYGVYGPEGKWLVEGTGVQPDIVVDNLPHATFTGKDAQLEAAIQYLQAELKKKPVPAVKPPAFPDKSFKPKAKK